jgi:hypothetical protein
MSYHRAPLLFAAGLLVVAPSSIAVAEDAPAAATNGPFRVELPDGASIELVGVGENGAGDRDWWRPDGSPLPFAPGGGPVEMADLTNSMLRTFAVWIVSDGKAQVEGPLPKGPAGEWSACGETYMRERRGNQFVEKRRTVAAMARSARTSIVINYAGGPWRTVTKVKRQGTGVFVGAGHDVPVAVVWDTASDENGAARISAAYHVAEPLVRIVAVDERDQEHESELSPGGTANDVRLASARFPGLPISRVKEFRFQTRPYNHEIEFRHVSLHAGQKNPVQMYLDGFRYLPKIAGAVDRQASLKLASAAKPAKPATDDEVLKRIIFNWRARQDRTKWFHFAWNTRSQEKSRHRVWIQDRRRALWVMNNDRFRFERALVGDGRSRWDRLDRFAREIRANDGSNGFALEWVRDTSQDPHGAICPGRGTRDFVHIECDPLYLTFRPFAPFLNWDDAEFQLVTRSESVDGVPCVKLKRKLRARTETVWVDPNRDDLVVRWEYTGSGELFWRIDISYRASPRCGWLPERWTCNYDRWNLEFECEVTTSAVNEQLPADAFQIDFPPGALVFDVPAHKEHVIAADGSRTPAPPFEAVFSPEFLKALNAVEPFTIEAEPIREAIEFLNQYHKLPIAIDELAFRKAGIETDTECRCDIEDMTLREQLRWLSASLPKPMRLVEKYGELRLTTVSSSKPDVRQK